MYVCTCIYNFVCINVIVTKYGYQNFREFQYNELTYFLFGFHVRIDLK